MEKILKRHGGRPGSESTIRLKASAGHDCETLSSKSILSGLVEKRNETGTWNLRNCAIVPHLFLYYFDLEGSQTNPRGVIDLDCFPDFSVGTDCTLRLQSSASFPSAREFLFRFQSTSDGEKWTEAIHRQSPKSVKARFAQLEAQVHDQIESNAKESQERELLSRDMDVMNRRMSAWNIELQGLSNQIRQTHTTVIAPDKGLDKLFIGVKDDISSVFSEREADKLILSTTLTDLEVAMKENEKLTVQLRKETEDHNICKSDLASAVSLNSLLKQEVLETNLQLQASTTSLHNNQSNFRDLQRDFETLVSELKKLTTEAKQSSIVIKQLETVNDQFRRAEKEHGSRFSDQNMERRLFAAANSNEQEKSSGWMKTGGLRSLFRKETVPDKHDSAQSDSDLKRIMDSRIAANPHAANGVLDVSEEVYNDL